MAEPRPHIAAVTPYSWEESSEAVAARLGIDPRDVVRFDMNTVPWRLPVRVSSDDFAVNEYPDPSYRELAHAMAAYCDVAESSVVVGAGADELIAMVAQAYLEPGRSFVVSDPTYSLFAIASGIAGARAVLVPCGEGFALDRARFLEAAAGADVVWLANPNNPTGEVLPQRFLRAVVEASPGLVVVDEAYAEFVDETALDWVGEVANVVVLRTLSKAFGLAGMRVGYAVAPPAVVAALEVVRPVTSISVVAARLGALALGHAAEMRALVAGLAAERSRLAEALAGGGRRVVAGAGNFVLAEVDGAAVQRALSRGLVMRTYGEGHRLHGWSRITVRSAEENARLLDALG